MANIIVVAAHCGETHEGSEAALLPSLSNSGARTTAENLAMNGELRCPKTSN